MNFPFGVASYKLRGKLLIFFFHLFLCSHSWLHSVIHQTVPSRWHGSTTAIRVRPVYCSLRKTHSHTQIFRGTVTPGSLGHKMLMHQIW